MFTKIIVVLNLIWQSIFLVGAIESFTKLKKFGSGNVFTFGYLWPSLLWSLGVFANLFLLVYLLKIQDNTRRKKLVVASIFLAIIPVTASYIIGHYYQTIFFKTLTQ